MLAPAAHVRPARAAGCLRDRAAVYRQAPAEAGRLVPVADFQLGRAAVSQPDPVGAARLVPVVGSQLVPVADFHMALILGVVSLLRRVTNGGEYSSPRCDTGCSKAGDSGGA